jgi:hypothetical protein
MTTNARRLPSLPLAAAGVLLAVVALAGSASAASGAPQADTLEGTWQTPSPVTFQGETVAELADGAVHARTPAADGLTVSLSAERLEVAWSWQKGHSANGVNGGDDIARATSEGGNEVKRFEDASLEAEGFQPSPEILVEITDPYATTRLATEGTGSVQALDDATVTRVEQPNETVWLGEEPERHGFWYEIEDPTVEHRRFDTAHVEGTFQVFLNNVSMTVDHADETWQHWTGHREDANGPSSSYESRVTVLTVENGTLNLRAEPSVTGYATSSTVDVDGQVEAEDAEGDLTLSDQRLVYDGDPLRVEGSGAIDLAAATDGADRAQRSTATPRLEASLQGPFDVAETPGVERVQISSSEDAGRPDPLLAGGLGLVLVVGAALALRDPLHRHLDEFRAELRRRRVEKWMQTGDRLTQVREFDRALGWYTRITDTYPNHAEGWYARASTLEELNRNEEAAAAYERVNALLGGDDPELLDMAGAAAWRAGNREKALECFLELARLEPRRLRERVHEEGFRDLLDEPRIENALSEGHQEKSYYA